jgi:hypothetical protein
VYNASNNRLIDLLIKDSNGETVPYFINSNQQETNTSRETLSLAQVDSYVKDDYFFFDYKLATERSGDTNSNLRRESGDVDRMSPQSGDTIATSMEFTTGNSDFAKSVDVYGSHDGMNWDYVQNDTLYAVEGKSKLAINFTRPQKFTHYRLRLNNNLERIFFRSVNLVYSVELSEKSWFIEKLIPPYTVESEDKKTKIIIEGLKSLRLCDMTIETDSMFSRNVRASGGITKELYYMVINDTVYADTTLPLNGHIVRDDTYVLTINDADDKPINIKSITVRYYADDLVFEGRAGETYTLEFGFDSIKNAPLYDIGRYRNEILKGPIDRLSMGAIRYTEAPPEPKMVINKIVFNVVVVLVTLLLGVLIVLRLRKRQED